MADKTSQPKESATNSSNNLNNNSAPLTQPEGINIAHLLYAILQNCKQNDDTYLPQHKNH